MTVETFGNSDIGGRYNNEDVWAHNPDLRLYVLADGMGGHLSGDVAAKQAVLALCETLQEIHPLPDSAKEWKPHLHEAFLNANTHVHHLAQENADMKGMGTTLVAALITETELLVGNVGDSRLYRVRKKRITQLTKDHSLRGELLAKGELDEKSAATFAKKNVITKAIGTQKKVEPDLSIFPIEKGDLYFLCSDGLSDVLNDKEILDVIDNFPTLPERVNQLIIEAKEQGGMDNITILMTEIK